MKYSMTSVVTNNRSLFAAKATLGAWLLLCLFSLAPLPALADIAEFGDYTVFYNTVNSTFLTPDIAEQYGITRGDRQAFLNISVQKKANQGSMEAVTATIRGNKSNLMQQAQDIEFIEVKEGPAIYYLGEFEFSNAEPVVFELHIQPEGRGPEYELSWDTRVYINQ